MTMTERANNIYFSDVFNVDPDVLEEYGAFDVSLLNDLPLFIDPFLLFHSQRSEYQALHDSIIAYVRFLRDKAVDGQVTDGLLQAWFMFSEVRQTWLGYSLVGNDGRGLGPDFARDLLANLSKVFTDFGAEKVTKGSHIEKLCLFAEHVGRDNISDFTTNLIKNYLLEYTQTFAREHLTPEQRRLVPVAKACFNYETEAWQSKSYELPFFDGDYIILTPVDMLAKDEIWINRHDIARDYHDIVRAIPDEQLRSQINNYFEKILPDDYKAKDEKKAKARVILEFPALLEHYIRFKEDHGDEAEALSDAKVEASKQRYIEQVRSLIALLVNGTPFYDTTGATLAETRARVDFLKDVIENKDGYRLFFDADEKPVRKERDLQIMFRFCWYNTLLDLNREVNNGRGPVDFTVSRGKPGKTLVEFKLASNTALRKNLQYQVDVYEKAADSEHQVKVVVFFTLKEESKVKGLLKELGLTAGTDVVLIDARPDNKPSASNAGRPDSEDEG